MFTTIGMVIFISATLIRNSNNNDIIKKLVPIKKYFKPFIRILPAIPLVDFNRGGHVTFLKSPCLKKVIKFLGYI